MASHSCSLSNAAKILGFFLLLPSNMNILAGINLMGCVGENVWQQHKYMTCRGKCNFNNANSSVFQLYPRPRRRILESSSNVSSFLQSIWRSSGLRVGEMIQYIWELYSIHSVSIGLFSLWAVIKGDGKWCTRNYGWGCCCSLMLSRETGRHVPVECGLKPSENRARTGDQTLNRWGGVCAGETLNALSFTCFVSQSVACIL